MKKVFLMILLLSLLTAAAMAEPQVTATVVGEQSVNSGEYAQELAILRLDIADGDTQIPSVYAVTQSTWLLEEKESLFSFEDVNFDGYDDLVMVTMAGASNTCFTFYLWNEDTGAYEWFGGEDVWNYQLYPEQNMILSTGTSGWAGLLHENKVYAWDASGRKLNLLRYSEWDTLSEMSNESEGEYMRYTELHDESMMVETYVDFEKGIDEAHAFPTKQYEDPQFMAQRFLAEDDFLGLEVTPEENEDGSNG